MRQAPAENIVALSGGVGGAKLALGLANILDPAQLTIVANTGDDFDHFGLRICPDLDSVMYTLAGMNNQQQGWGLEGESWNCMEAMARLGGETWFSLGDRDLATHLQRSALLAAGHSLTEATRLLCERLSVGPRLLPMSDQRVSTQVLVAQGRLSFQHYFVREACRPVVCGFEFDGVEEAEPGAGFIASLQDDKLAAVVICPSNPFVSIAPILALTGVKEALQSCKAPVIAVSPIIAGQAVKGPTAKMMQELGIACDAAAVAAGYEGIIDGFVLDVQDQPLAQQIAANGVSIAMCNTLMKTLDDRKALAGDILAFAQGLKPRPE